jgi:hypothetical protein
MLARWLLTCALICGMLLAPVTMAAARAPAPTVDRTASHCAPSVDADQHAPAKPLRCLSACAAVETGLPRLAARVRAVAPMMPLPASVLPRGVLCERDTPPPRLS